MRFVIKLGNQAASGFLAGTGDNRVNEGGPGREEQRSLKLESKEKMLKIAFVDVAWVN